MFLQNASFFAKCKLHLARFAVDQTFGGKLIVRLKGYPKTEIQVSKEKAQRLKEWIDR